METYPKGPWKAIAEMVDTRTVRQTQTHAQKCSEKLVHRMRGLRNPDGTLQTSPMTTATSMPGMAVYPRAAVSHYPTSAHVYHHAPQPGAMGYAPPSGPGTAHHHGHRHGHWAHHVDASLHDAYGNAPSDRHKRNGESYRRVNLRVHAAQRVYHL